MADQPDQQPKILQYQNAVIGDDVQQMLNQPLSHGNGLNPEDGKFLNILMEKIDKGEINLYRPSTLLNYSVYDHLPEMAKGKADFDAVNMLTTVREIRKLWNMGHRNTYQIENHTRQLRMIKERLEQLGGDIFVI